MDCFFQKKLYNSSQLTLLITISFLMFSTPGLQAENTIFKVAMIAPERSVWMTTYQSLADEVKAQTGGQVQFKCYPGGVQGDDITVIRKTRIGQLHGAGLTGTGLSLICKESMVLQTPLMFQDTDEFDYVFSKMQERFISECNENGFEVLGWPHLGFSYIFSNDKVADLNSLRGAKPWLLEDDMMSKALYDVASITPVPAQVGDVLTGLRSGLMHTVYGPPSAMISLQWFSRIKYRLDLRLSYSFGAFVVVKKKWDQLSPELRQKVKGICDKKFQELNTNVRSQNQEALAILESKQIVTITPTEQGLNEFNKIVNEVGKKIMGITYSEKTFSIAQSILSEYRTNHH